MYLYQNDREMRYEKDMIVNMTYEEEKLSTLIEQEAKQLRKLREITNFVERYIVICENIQICPSKTV